VNTALTDSSSRPKKCAKSHVKSRTKTSTPNFASENPCSILQSEQDAQTPTTTEISTAQGKKKFPQIVITSKISDFNFLKDPTRY
jgi:hypothetical protein